MLKGLKCVVFKVGTSTLTHASGRTNIRRMEALVKTLSDLMNSGLKVVLVSSGAIGVGAGKLALPSRPDDTPGRQAAAAVGQCELMFMYDKMFSEYGHTVGQLLITREDFEEGERRSHLLNTFEKLFQYEAIPIVNENDSVAVDEIVFGDNDMLSASVAELIGADALVMLTDTDGLYDRDPAQPGALLLAEVDEITPEIERMAQGAGSALGTGGMITKLAAAKYAGRSGIDTVVMNSEPISNIYDLIDGKSVGTLFKAVKK
ncbi:MAG: glutamate 5-kinase [Oscillospiraceae bacterium]|nr:glutamate 5-kinase [Oscillospiraceae bacterium]